MPYDFECSAFIPGCVWRVSRDTREDTVDEMERHARDARGLAELPDELTNRLRASTQPTN